MAFKFKLLAATISSGIGQWPFGFDPLSSAHLKFCQLPGASADVAEPGSTESEEPCVSFRSDHEVPIVADDGSSLGYVTVHSGGGALLVSVDSPKASPFHGEQHNLRAHFTRAFPRHCAMATVGLNGSAPLEHTGAEPAQLWAQSLERLVKPACVSSDTGRQTPPSPSSIHQTS